VAREPHGAPRWRSSPSSPVVTAAGPVVAIVLRSKSLSRPQPGRADFSSWHWVWRPVVGPSPTSSCGCGRRCPTHTKGVVQATKENQRMRWSSPPRRLVLGWRILLSPAAAGTQDASNW
jgi:hypothetical protein